MNPVSADSPALSTDRIAFLLSHVDANDRTEWVRMGMAVKDALGDDGLSIWLRWSQSSPKYRHRDAMAVWHSMRKSGISIGTLIVTARNHGAAVDHDDDLHLLPMPIGVSCAKLNARTKRKTNSTQEHARFWLLNISTKQRARRTPTSLAKVFLNAKNGYILTLCKSRPMDANGPWITSCLSPCVDTLARGLRS